MNFKQAKHLVQGDVILRPLESLPPEARLVETNAKVLQQSEVTGHHHQFTPRSAVDLYVLPREAEAGVDTITPNEGKCIVVNKPSFLFHGKLFDHNPSQSGSGDHNSLLVEPGTYFIDIVREYDYDYHRVGRVVD